MQTLGLQLETLKLMPITSFTGIFLRFCLNFKYFLTLNILSIFLSFMYVLAPFIMQNFNKILNGLMAPSTNFNTLSNIVFPNKKWPFSIQLQ